MDDWMVCTQWSETRKQPISFCNPLFLGFWVAQTVKSLPEMQETWV